MRWIHALKLYCGRIASRVKPFVRANPYISLLVLYYALAFVTPEKKLFVALSVLFVVSIWFIYRRWNAALVLGYMALSPLVVGQVYVLQVLTPAQLFFDSHYPTGRALTFILTPAFLIGLVMLVSAVRLFFSGAMKYMVRVEALLFMTIIFIQFLSTLQASHAVEFSFLFGLQRSMILAWFILASKEYADQKKFMTTICLTGAIAAGLNGFMALLQLVKGGPVGTIIEQRATATSGEISVSFFRAFGLDSHPNNMANTLLVGIFISMLVYFFSRKRYGSIALIVGALASIGIVISQSRAGYLGLACLLLPLGFLYMKQNKISVVSLLQYRLSAWWALVSIGIILLGTPFIMYRLYNTLLFSISDGGTIDVRSQLAQEAWVLIRERPFLGVGLGMFIPAAFARNVTGVMYWFPEAVHNGFLLIASESGVFALLSSIGMLYWIFRRLTHSRQSIYLRFMIGAFVCSQVIFMMFHPIDNMTTIGLGVVILLLSSF